MTWMCLLLTGLVGCRDDRNDRLLADAEACMETRADSARWLLQQTDSILTDEQQARYALLWTQAMHKCHIPLEGDSLINVAVEYYSGTDDMHRLAKALLYKGLAHKQLGEMEKAVEAFVSSEQAFEGVDDDQYKALLYGHYASLLMKQNLLTEALGYYKKSYGYKLRGDSIHYIVSACSDIATIYELLNLPDSAKVYYDRGMEYREQISEKRYSLFAVNYATFLLRSEKYMEAETILRNSEMHISDSAYIYNVYSSLSTLYYAMGEYEKALPYGEKMQESPDSLIQCVGFLHLYRIHKRLGDLEKAVHYHDLYRRYDSDLTLRRKTAKVAEIPHRMKAYQLAEETRTAHHWQWVWGIGLSAAIVAAVYIIRYLRRKHSIQMEAKEGLLSEKQSLLEEIERKLYDLRIELGRVKGSMTNQKKAICSLKEERLKDKEAYDESVKELEEAIREKDEEYKTERKAMQEKYRELAKRVSLSEKEQTRWSNEVKDLTEQMGQYELLQRYLLDGGSIRAVLLILELKNGKPCRNRAVKRTDYAELLKQLADYACPGIRQRIETDEVLRNKQEMACLIALGFDDTEMLRIATNLQPNSVKAYRTQVKKALAIGQE